VTAGDPIESARLALASLPLLTRVQSRTPSAIPLPCRSLTNGPVKKKRKKRNKREIVGDEPLLRRESGKRLSVIFIRAPNIARDASEGGRGGGGEGWGKGGRLRNLYY